VSETGAIWAGARGPEPTTPAKWGGSTILEPAGPAPVNRDLAPGMADAQLVAGDHHAHAFTDQPPPHRIGVAVNPDHTVSLHLAHQLERHRKRRNASDRAQSSGLRTPEALDRHLTGRAVLPLISDIGGQLSKRRPAIARAHARSACWRYHAASWSGTEACPESRPAISSHVRDAASLSASSVWT
jgi:hypothetical protein